MLIQCSFCGMMAPEQFADCKGWKESFYGDVQCPLCVIEAQNQALDASMQALAFATNKAMTEKTKPKEYEPLTSVRKIELD